MSSPTTEVGACTVRITRLNADGTPSTGDPQGAILICSGIITFTPTPEIEEGDEIGPVKDSCGNTCISGKRPDGGVKWIDIEIEFCKMSFDVAELLGQETLILDGATVVGTAVEAGGGCGANPASEYVAIELWAENWECSGPAAGNEYLRYIYPKAIGRITPSGVSGDPTSYTWSGIGYANPNFGTGAFADLTPPVAANHLQEKRNATAASVPVCANSYEYVATP